MQRKNCKLNVKLYHIIKNVKTGKFSSFLSSGAPKFTKTPQNSFLALEGDNITLEWRYTFVDKESFLSALLRKDGGKVVNKHFALSKPVMQRAYRGRLHANMTDDYTLITLLGVNRLDKGSYMLEVTSLPDEEGNTSAVEISVLCKYKETLKTMLHKQTRNNFSSL